MTDNSGYWIHDMDPVLIHLWGEFGIRYYGLAYAVGFMIGAWLLRIMYKRGRSPLTPQQQSVTVTALILGVVVGARVGYVLLYEWTELMHNPAVLFQVWKGGMSSHGGMAGVLLAGWWIAWHYRLSFLKLGDIICTITPPGIMFGRIANFINGELWGTKTTVPWAVIFPKSAPFSTTVETTPPRHPSQLYEAALEGALLFVYLQWRLWKTKAGEIPGRIMGEFFLFYAVARIFCEFFRAPDSPLILGMNRGIFYSLFLAGIGIVLIVRANRIQRQQAE